MSNFQFYLLAHFPYINVNGQDFDDIPDILLSKEDVADVELRPGLVLDVDGLGRDALLGLRNCHLTLSKSIHVICKLTSLPSLFLSGKLF